VTTQGGQLRTLDEQDLTQIRAFIDQWVPAFFEG
jgi:hypothetical protein